MKQSFLFVIAFSALVSAQRGGPPAQEPKAVAPIDLTGYWVSIVSEDWRYRMVTPTRGDYQGVPMTPDAVKIADAWNPDADTRAGNQCKSYGAAAIMRVPGRVHITWDDDRTLKLEADAGTQTRIFRFSPAAAKSEPSWQGESIAQWETPGGGRGGGRGRADGGGGRVGGGRGGPNTPQTGALKVVTTNLKAGYLRKNGVPHSEDATVTEYFDLATERNGDVLLVVTSIVDDPTYLRQPFIVSSQFKKQPDVKGWDPTPCSSTW